MIEVLLRSLFVSVLGTAALRLARKRSASVRHALVIATLAGAFAAVAFAPFLPPFRLPVLPAPTSGAPASAATVSAPDPISSFVARSPGFSSQAPTAGTANFGLWGWTLIAALLVLRPFGAWLRLGRSLRGARKVEDLDAGIAVLESDAFAAPFLAWLGRPTLVLPASWRTWPSARIDLVVRHEVAHLRRGDGVSRLFAGLVRAIVWPNPLVWWLVHQEARLAERAVDDLLVAGGVPPAAYAEVLLATAHDVRRGPVPVLSMASKAEVSGRIEMILDPLTPRRAVSSLARRTFLLAGLVLAVPVALGTLESPQKATPAFPEPTLQFVDGQPVQILLKCKAVKTAEAGRDPFSSSPKDPTPKDAKIVSAPTIRTLAGQDATINVACDDVTSGAKLLPILKKDGRIRLHVRGLVYDRGLEPSGSSLDPEPPSRDTFKAYADVKPGEWVRFWMTGRDGKFRNYAMLVQVLRVPDGA